MPTESTRAVFLSYASQDAEAARRICDTLRASGVEVWFDADGGLEHGDEWDAKIRRQIKECVLFIPVISANTQARHEGYFRIEWDLAAERARGIASGVPFILPVVIDDTREPDALVPDRFRAVQWTKLRAGEVPPEVQQRFLKLWSHRTGVLKHEAARNELEPGRPRPGERDEGVASPSVTPQVGRRVPAAAWFAAAALALLAGGYFIAKRPSESPPPSLQNAGAGTRPPTTEKPVAPLSEARKLLAQARALLETGDDLNRENFTLAEELLKRANTLDPADAEILAAQALLADDLVNFGYDKTTARLEIMRTQAERAIKFAPESDQAAFAYALYLMRVDFFAGQASAASRDSLARLRALVAKAPQNKAYHRALAFMLLGNPATRAEAYAEWDRANAQPGGDALAMAQAGMNRLFDGDPAEAERAIAASLVVRPNGRALIADVLLKLCWRGDLDGALAVMQRWPGWLMQEERGALVAATVWAWRKDFDKALSAIRAVNHEVFRDTLYVGPRAAVEANILELAGRPDAARAEWERSAKIAEAMTESGAMPVWHRAWARAKIGDKPGAEAALRVFVQSWMGGKYEPLYLPYWSGSLVMDVRELITGPTVASFPQLEKFVLGEANGTKVPRAALRLNPAFDPWRKDPRFAALLAAAPAPEPANAATPSIPAPAGKSVAVLPFANQSDDKANESFSDGISEELGVVLGKVPGLRIAGWNSSLSFKGKNVPEAEIAQKLVVTHIVSGSVRRDGTQVRITARLVNAADGFELWSDSFKREAKDIFAVQDEMAGLIAEKLKLKLGVDARRSRAVNPEAHRLVLEGRHFWNLRNEDGFTRAEAAFLKAIELDQTFAEAHAGLAGVYVIRATDQTLEGSAPEIADDLRRAQRAAVKAVELAPELAESHAVLAYILLNQGDQVAGEREFEQALKLNPNSATTITWSSVLQTARGRLDLALRGYAKSAELDPLWFINLHLYSEALFYAGRYDEALRMADRAAALRSDTFIPNLGIRAVALFALGRSEEAIRLARLITANPNADTRWNADAHAIHVLRKNGAAAEAESHAAETLRRLQPTSPVRTQVFIALERFDEAMQTIGGFRATMLRFLFWEPILDPWRDDPRLRAALAQLGRTEDYQTARATLARLKAESAAKK